MGFQRQDRAGAIGQKVANALRRGGSDSATERREEREHPPGQGASGGGLLASLAPPCIARYRVLLLVPLADMEPPPRTPAAYAGDPHAQPIRLGCGILGSAHAYAL
jgi:hypothetical protein